MARENRPAARGEPTRVQVLTAPADSPKRRTRVGVAAEAGGVGLHPREGGDLIPDPVVAGDAVIGLGGELGVDEEAEGAEAIVEGDDDEVVGGGEGGSVVERIVACRLSPAWDPGFSPPFPPLGSICVTRAIVDQAALRDPVFDERERAGFWRAR
jgi:hypothetical protein